MAEIKPRALGGAIRDGRIFMRVLYLLCALLLVASLLAACSKKPGGNGAPADNLADVLHPRSYEFSADWPENEFTVEVNYSTALGNLATLAIKKPT
jgi:hypothetical protein